MSTRKIEVAITYHLPEGFNEAEDWRNHPVLDDLANTAFDVEDLGDVSMFATISDDEDDE